VTRNRDRDAGTGSKSGGAAGDRDGGRRCAGHGGVRATAMRGNAEGARAAAGGNGERLPVGGANRQDTLEKQRS
jgi:hypothetical protein